MNLKLCTLPVVTACLLMGAFTAQAFEAGYRYIPRSGSAAAPASGNWNGRTYTDAHGAVRECVTGDCATKVTPSFTGRHPQATRDRGFAQMQRGELSLQDGNRSAACKAYRKAQSLFDSVNDSAMSADAAARAADACSDA